MTTDKQSIMMEISKPHWSSRLQDVLSGLRSSQRILVASDFDGTLSPLVEHAGDAAILPAAAEAVKGLLALHPRVRLAFLSGRSVSDLTKRLGTLSDHVILSGNHGLELRGGGLDWDHPVCTAVRPLLESLMMDLRSRTEGIPGVELEDKGASLTVHYRRADAREVTALREILTEIEVPPSIRVHQGKMIVEFRPGVSWNKGRAIRRIMNHLDTNDESVVYLGDDVTDEDVFKELSSAAVTVHVGDAPEHSAAAYHALDPADAAAFLRALAGLRES